MFWWEGAMKRNRVFYDMQPCGICAKKRSKSARKRLPSKALWHWWCLHPDWLPQILLPSIQIRSWWARSGDYNPLFLPISAAIPALPFRSPPFFRCGYIDIHWESLNLDFREVPSCAGVTGILFILFILKKRSKAGLGGTPWGIGALRMGGMVCST